MRHVFTLGETVLDIIFRNGNPVKSFAGGSMLNTAIALGRMGCYVDFISEFGNDEPGSLIESSLSENYVSVKHSVRYKDFNTSVALAFLDEKQEASYTFYHNQPAGLTSTNYPVFDAGDILAFGSFYSVKPSRREHVSAITGAAHRAGALIIFDPNVRKHHLADMPAVSGVFFDNMRLASIIKGSGDDFEFLSGTADPEKIYDTLKSYCPVIIITQGAGDVLLFTPAFREKYKTPGIQPVSTIGAGDNFTAGLIYGLIKMGVSAPQLPLLPQDEWGKLIASGIAFASATCQSLENYIPTGFNPTI